MLKIRWGVWEGIASSGVGDWKCVGGGNMFQWGWDDTDSGEGEG